MTIKEQVIEKVRILPNNVAREVDDYIDFLRLKKRVKKSARNLPASAEEVSSETDMSDYLKNLVSYETLLSQGKIRWK